MSTAEEARARKRLKLRFEATCDLFANIEGLQAWQVFGTIIPYRDWLTKNTGSIHGPLSPRKFIGWMESADRSVGGWPDPRAQRLIEQFDELLIEAVRDHGMPPAEAVDALDEWVDDSKAEFIAMDVVPDDFFDGGDSA